MAPKIAIIGAGPGGCMLARLLHTRNISCTIFEAETSIDYRSQGGTLDLRTKTGLVAIKEAGLWDAFLQHARYDGESLLITDKNLTTWLRRSPGKPSQKQNLHEAPEIDRSDLRRLLVESVPKESIRWGMKLARVQEIESGYQLHFATGQLEQGFDLIVGCEGAWSKTRKLLTSEMPYYTGLGGWTMQIPNAEMSAPEVYKLVNRGSVFAYSNGQGLSIQQLSSGNIWISAYSPQADDFGRARDHETEDLASVKEKLAKQFADWAPSLRDVFKEAQGDVARRSLHMLPVGFTWPHRTGITLLGDAAHLMTPFSGIGVNTAFYDALLLSRQIVEYTKAGQQDDLDDYIVRYEEEMFEHANQAQRHTEGSMIDLLFVEGAPRTTIESYLLRFIKADLPAWLHAIVTAIVYSGYWLYKWFV